MCNVMHHSLILQNGASFNVEVEVLNSGNKASDDREDSLVWVEATTGFDIRKVTG